jgi:hypothetical protein
MSAIAERALVRMLTDNQSLVVLSRDGIETDILPTEEIREVVQWALDYRSEGGRAPTRAALKDRFEDVLNDNEIDLDEEVEETLEWVLTKLHSSFAHRTTNRWTRELATDIAEAPDEDKVDVLAAKAAELASIVQMLAPRRSQIDMRRGGKSLLEDYHRVVASGGLPEGLLFGLPEIDNYTRGIHDGELAMVAAPSKMGKSFVLDFTAVEEWQRGRIAALFTLENSIPMTMQRMACKALNISLSGLAHGTLDDEDVAKVEWWVNDVLVKSEVPLHIFNPPPSMRTPQAMVQQARAVGADSIILDQLTFMEAVARPGGRSRESQSEEVGRILHDLKALISTGRWQIPCLTAHQMNREGTELAEKTGKLVMTKMANSSETERTIDWGFGLYASHDQRVTNRMEWQTMAARRAEEYINFELNWHIDVGRWSVRRQIAA